MELPAARNGEDSRYVADLPGKTEFVDEIPNRRVRRGKNVGTAIQREATAVDAAHLPAYCRFSFQDRHGVATAMQAETCRETRYSRPDHYRTSTIGSRHQCSFHKMRARSAAARCPAPTLALMLVCAWLSPAN